MDTTTWMHIAEVTLAGAVTGVLGALLGTGGGVFLIPILVILIGLPMHHAVATSILSVIATSSAVASTNVERGTANMRLGMTLELATSLGAILGGVTAGWIRPRILEGIFAVVLLPTAALMWRSRRPSARESERPAGQGKADIPEPPARDLGALGATYIDPAEGGVVSYRVGRLPGGLLVSFLAGNLSGLLGIGGGVFKVPALHLLCGVPIKAAAATSNFMIGVTAAASASLYYGRGEVRPALTAATVLGVLGGSALGTYFSPRIGGHSIRRMFAVLLVAVAIQMLVRAAMGGA